MTDIDLDAIRKRHDEDHEHDGGCDTLDLLAEVERLRAAATHEVAAHETRVARLTTRIEKAEAEALRWKTASAVLASLAQHRDEMARLMRTLDANSPEDRERLGRWWDEGATSPDVVEKAYARVDAVLAYLTGEE